jgi:protein SCO1/2
MTDKVKRGSSSTIVLITALVVMTIVGIAAVVLFSQFAPCMSANCAAPTPSDFTGVTVLDIPVEVPDFTMTNQDGKPTSLSDLRGKPTLIFFGFTHCPDVCPNTLIEFREVHETIGDKVNYVFISIDGARDTPEAMKARIETSNVPFVVGLTDTPEAVLKAGAPFNLVVEADPPDENGSYDIAHTASVFLLNADGQWIAKYAYGTLASTIIEDLQGRVS